MAAVPPAPYSTRPVRLADAEEVAALANVNAVAHVGERITDADELRGEWQAPGYDLGATSLAVTAPDGSLAAVLLVDAQPPYTAAIALGEVAPGHRGRGLGTFLLQRGDELARRALAPGGGREPAVLRWDAWVGAEGLFALLRAHGFAPVRHFWLMRIGLQRPPAAPAWAGGIAVRTFRTGDQRRFYDAFVESFRDHWGDAEPFFERFVHEQIESEGARFDPALWFLAMDGDEVAGIAICQPDTPSEPDCGYIRDLGVRPAWRRRGIGRALLLHSFAALRERGARAVSLHVDAASPTGAPALYESAGMTAHPHFELWERPLAHVADAFADAPRGDPCRMSSDPERRPDEEGWEPPEGDEVTEPEELAEADPDMRQSPLRVEEQPDVEE